MDADEARSILDQEERRGLDELVAAADLSALEAAETSVLGRRSRFQEVQRSLGALAPDDRKEVGRRTNEVRDALRAAVAERRAALEAAREDVLLEADAVDVTLPGRRPRPGSFHPLTIVEHEIVDIFTRMGYRVVEGPEVETEYYNFDALNIPPEHPARRVSDSIYLDVPGHLDLLLRTETSRDADPNDGAAAAPGLRDRAGPRVPPRPVDATHMPVFHQVEGLAVDEGITFADLKGTLGTSIARCWARTSAPLHAVVLPVRRARGAGRGVVLRLRRRGCRVSGNGWIELMGAGMVHPNVLRDVGYDPERYTGFAFGGGYDRLTMARFSIPDIRMLFDGDVRFLARFEGAR